MFDSKKAIQMLVYSIQYKGGMIDIGMALVMVWFADRLHSRRYGCTITHAEYIVTEQGIFPFELYRMIVKSSFDSPSEQLYFEKHLNIERAESLTSRVHFEHEVLTTGEIQCVREICGAVSKLATNDITDMKNFYSKWTNSMTVLNMMKCKVFSIDELDLLLDADTKIKTNKLTEIFTKDNPLDLVSPNMRKSVVGIFTNY